MHVKRLNTCIITHQHVFYCIKKIVTLEKEWLLFVVINTHPRWSLKYILTLNESATTIDSFCWGYFLLYQFFLHSVRRSSRALYSAGSYFTIGAMVILAALPSLFSRSLYSVYCERTNSFISSVRGSSCSKPDSRTITRLLDATDSSTCNCT